MFLFANIIFITFITTVYGTEDMSTSGDQQDYFYFNYQARDAAVHLQKYLSDLDDKFEACLVQLRKNNKASLALIRYNKAVALSKGTDCALKVTGDHNKAQKDIESIVDSCQSLVPQNDLKILSKKLKEAVAKVEMIDKTLRYHAKICSTKKAILSPKCIENKEKALAKLNAVLSVDEKAQFEYYSKSAFSSIKTSLERCVDGATTDLEEHLEDSTNVLQDCLVDIPFDL